MASTMIRPRKALGDRAEVAVAEHYAAAGYTIEARNWTCRGGELDVVARRGALLVFIEVRARSGRALVSPIETVSAAKQRRVARAADRYLAQTRIRSDIRFDVVGVSADGRRLQLDVIENAFVPDWAF